MAGLDLLRLSGFYHRRFMPHKDRRLKNPLPTDAAIGSG
jgi:hypothetical protein